MNLGAMWYPGKQLLKYWIGRGRDVEVRVDKEDASDGSVVNALIDWDFYPEIRK